MAMQGNAEIRVQTNLAKGTTKRLQTQLNSISKKLTLNIRNVKIQNKFLQKSISDGMKKANEQIGRMSKEAVKVNDKVVKANKKQISSIDTVISRYKMQRISYNEMQQAYDKMVKRGTFQQQSLKQQEKMITNLNRAEKEHTKLLNERVKVQQKVKSVETPSLSTLQVQGMGKSKNKTFDQWFMPKAMSENIKSAKSSMDVFTQSAIKGVKVQDKFGNVNKEVTESFKKLNPEMMKAGKNQFAFGTMLGQSIKKMVLWSN